jgi:hypothetical protein
VKPSSWRILIRGRCYRGNSAQIPLAGSAAFCQTSPRKSATDFLAYEAVLQPLTYLTRRIICLAALLLPLVSGCALWNWNKADWTMDNYRDSRAVDIDHRLEKGDTGVKNPF